MKFSIRKAGTADAHALRKFTRDQWGDETVAAHGILYRPETLQGFVAEVGNSRWVGLATYMIENGACELVTLNSTLEGEGIGSALVKAVENEATAQGCTRIWCVTTNDNFPAMTFYQKRGFRIVAVYPDAVDRARILKPSIPLWGIESVPIRDEIELEKEVI